jgi:signal transduction histidine kinase/CheY-like chemotaxis protein
MVQKPKAVKYKVIAGYLLLFATAVVSVWFVYTEILKIARPAQNADDNNKIIRISNTIAILYESEAIGRSSILTGSAKEFKYYNKLTDSIRRELDTLKKNVEPAQAQKFDSIQLLLARKKNSVKEIIEYRKSYSADNTFTKAISGIYGTKDSIWNQIKPVKPTRPYQWQKVVNSLLSPKQLDSLSKLQVSNDSLAMAFENVLTNLLIKDNKLRNRLYRKEQKLLEENRIISDQLRAILASVENEFIQKSYQKISSSRATLANTINTMAWVGAATLFFLIIFAYIIIRDLSINQNYRKQLEVLNHENEDLLRSKSMLMATVTHDLQTPLGSIIGFHDLLKTSGVTPKQRLYIANIKESANYIQKLVNDLLDFSRLENNRITIEQSSFNMKATLEAACRVLEPMADDKNIELIWDIEDGLNANFVSDPYRIKQILTNLISNAIKFTTEGYVKVTAIIDGFDIVISVTDTGIGIAPQNHDAVFKEFTQAHAGIEKKFGGTGLGLTISKRILELLDGSISIESQEGKGSTFTIKLPRIAGKATPAENIELVKTHYPALKNKKILVTDDDAVQLKLMQELLQNYDVTTEINSAAVLPLLENDQYDIVLSDIQMPSIDGFELVQKIRQHPNSNISQLPVIALSGKRDLTATDFTSRGFTAHHPKPLQLDELLKLMAGIFGGDVATFTSKSINDFDYKGNLYNLSSLSQFTQNDPASLKTILDTFIDSAYDNCSTLQKQAKNSDIDGLAQTAHKMIPMLRQLEVYNIADKLLHLEEKTVDVDYTELTKYVDGICNDMVALCDALQLEIA